MNKSFYIGLALILVLFLTLMWVPHSNIDSILKDHESELSSITTAHITWNQSAYVELMEARFKNETDLGVSVLRPKYFTTIDLNLPSVRTRGNRTIYTFDGLSKSETQKLIVVAKEFNGKYQCAENNVSGFLSTSCVFTNVNNKQKPSTTL